MPTYEYVCEKCGHQFEMFQSMKDDPIKVCPPAHCARKAWGKGKVKRQMGAGAGLIFKGSGFYITDYRSANYREAASKEKASSAPPSTPASGSDAKSTPAKSAPSTPTPKAPASKTPA